MSIGNKIKGFFINHGQKLLNITTGVSGIYCIEQLCEGKYVNATYAGITGIVTYWINKVISNEKKIKKFVSERIENNENMVEEMRDLGKDFKRIFQDLLKGIEATRENHDLFYKVKYELVLCGSNYYTSNNSKILKNTLPFETNLNEIVGNNPIEYDKKGLTNF